MNHEFKCDVVPFHNVWVGAKRAEVRNLADREHCEPKDMLILREWDSVVKAFTGRYVNAIVTHVQSGCGLPPDVFVISFHAIALIDDSNLKRDAQIAADKAI